MTAAPAPTVGFRDRKGRFALGGPGRQPGNPNRAGMLDKALRLVEKGRGRIKGACTCTLRYHQKAACQTLDAHFARLAFFDPVVLIAVQKKRIPDLQHQTGSASPSIVNVIYGHKAAPADPAHVPSEGNGRDA